jgi:hypothetical protein
VRAILLAWVFCLALAVPLARAGGVNINWGDGCWSDGTPVSLLAFPCNTNTGMATMTCSFAVDYDMPQFAGVEITLDGFSGSPTIPAWWQMATGECRAGAISTSADFLQAPQVGCQDMWGGHALGGLATYGWGPRWGGNDRDRAHMLIGFAVAPEQLPPITAGIEYYAAQIRIGYEKTAGDDACAGCGTSFVWYLYSIKAAELGQYEMLYEPISNDGSLCLVWQAGYASAWTCYVPVRNTTWGQVKSLYR